MQTKRLSIKPRMIFTVSSSPTTAHWMPGRRSNGNSVMRSSVYSSTQVARGGAGEVWQDTDDGAREGPAKGLLAGIPAG
jgi:hypothetical protein